MSVNRRDFLRRAAGMASAAAWAGKSSLVSAQTAALPDPADSGIEHIVVVMMENRSFDHMLGYLSLRHTTGKMWMAFKTIPFGLIKHPAFTTVPSLLPIY